ncbi:glycosyltransferase family 4 protein [Rhodococcus sp. KRD175]|uniref:glycosyltransferase family 4 protein n=1 Tax=Rhodococcus sp. KRD175 TaxID=2729729 RepID=UPI0019D02828|nr:glycosyltransferase family 4 protein [Rhodococcus sp. KRD175]
MKKNEMNVPRRITLLAINYFPEKTGIAPYVTNLAEELSARGHKVSVVTAMPHYPEWKIASEYRSKCFSREVLNGVKITRVRPILIGNNGAKSRLILEIAFGAFSSAVGWGKPDMVLAVSPALVSTGMALLRSRLFLRRPVTAVWVQDIYSLGVEETGLMGTRATKLVRRLESGVIAGADATAVIHERFKSYLVKKLDIAGEGIKVLPNWSHVMRAKQSDRVTVRESMGWRPDETIVVHAGNMGVKQGLDNVIAAARIAERDGLNVRFCLVGDGNQKELLLADARGITTVQFIRSLPGDQFMEVLAAADILLVHEKPGISEMAVPSKLTTYFATGKPILSVSDPDSVTTSVVREARAGVTVDAGNPHVLVNAVINLTNDPALCETLGQAGLRHTEACLGQSTAIDEFELWVDQLVRQGPEKRRTSRSWFKKTKQ